MIDRKPWLVFSAAMLATSISGCAPGANGGKAAEVHQESEFEETACHALSAQISHPKGWYLTELSPMAADFNMVVTECLITQNPVELGKKPVGPAISISRLEKIPLGRAEKFAELVVQTPRSSAVVVGDSYRETTVGNTKFYQGQFTSSENNVLSHQWVWTTNIEGDVYMAILTVPKTSAQAAYEEYGAQMFDSLKIKGRPNGQKVFY